MVMDFGMSRLGRMTYRESGPQAFIPGGVDLPRERYHSEQTAREIDQEIKRIIDESLEKARHILETRCAALEALAKCLIEKEVVDTEELKQIIEANCPNPVIVPGTAASGRRAGSAKSEPPAAESRPLKAEDGAG
jgi:cell division protease FtsH